MIKLIKAVLTILFVINILSLYVNYCYSKDLTVVGYIVLSSVIYYRAKNELNTVDKGVINKC